MIAPPLTLTCVASHRRGWYSVLTLWWVAAARTDHRADAGPITGICHLHLHRLFAESVSRHVLSSGCLSACSSILTQAVRRR